MATVSDNFDRTDSTNLGSNWAEDSGDWAIVSNYVRQETTTGVYRKLRWTGTSLASNNVAVQAVVQCSTGDIGSGVYARGATDSTVTYYGLLLFPGYGVYLVEITGGTESILGSYTTSPPAVNTDVTLRLECDGSTLRGYVNGTERINVSDSTLTSGSVGLITYGGGTSSNLTRANDWTAYDLSSGVSLSASMTVATSTPTAALTVPPIAPEFINATTNGSSTTGTSLSLSLPTNAQAGDVLIAALAWEVASPTITAPNGWTQITSSTPSGTSRTHRQATYYRVMQSGDTGPWSWTTTSAYERCGVMAAYRYTQAPTVSSASTTNSSSVSATAPGITTGSANSLAVMTASNMYGTTWTAPTNYTERADYRTGTGTGNMSISMHSYVYASAGATGNVTATSANADYYVASLIELVFVSPALNLAASATVATTTPSGALDVARALGAAASVATTTPTAELGVTRTYTASATVATSTPDATLDVATAQTYSLTASATVATSTTDAALGVTRTYTAAAAVATTTPTAALGVARALAASATVATSTPTAALAVVRTFSAAATTATTTPTAVLGVTRTYSATASVATSTPDGALTIARSLAASATVATSTPTASLSISGSVTLTAAMTVESATPSSVLAVARSVAATCPTATTTPNATLGLLVPFSGAMAVATSTPTAALAVARSVAASATVATSTPDATLSIAGLVTPAAAMLASTETPDAVLAVQRLLAGGAAVATTTPDATLDRGIRPTAALTVETATGDADLRVARALQAALAVQTLTPDAAMYTTALLSLAAQMGIFTATSAAILVNQLVAGGMRLTATGATPDVAMVGATPACVMVGAAPACGAVGRVPEVWAVGATPTVDAIGE